MTSKEFNNSIRTNCLGEFIDKEENVCIICVDYRDETNELIAGECCNTGLIPITSIIYDNDYHIDTNIEILWNKLEGLGYERIG